MKRCIRSDSTISLSDILTKINYFVVVDDCDECDLAVINASDDIDEDDSEYYLSLPDSRLSALSKQEVRNISNIDVLARLARVCKEKLSEQQLAAVKAEFRKKVPLDDAAKQELLDLFKQCNTIVMTFRKKNTDFIAQYHLSNDDILSILHSLKVSDFSSATKSINYSHLGDNLIIFKPHILIPHENRMIGTNLYVKLDIDESTKSAAVFISLHPQNEGSYRRS